MRVGTRASPLALAQAQTVAELLGEDAELVPITTSGDRHRAATDKQKWVKELELALLGGDVDLALHSAKDVPSELPSGLELVGAPLRSEPLDALVGAASITALRAGARVGTASVRRAAQLSALREDLDVVEIRGNVDTRLRKLAEGEVDALVLAAAGLIRLGLEAEIGCLLGELVPCAGQGTLVLEGRADDDDARAAAWGITDIATWVALRAERRLVSGLDASCNTPVGAHASIGDDGIVLRTFVGLPDGSAWLRDETPPAATPIQAGELAASRLLSAGAADLLRRAEELLPMTAYLVGAGPGDAGLMTARSLELIARADVILYDRLIPVRALDGARADAELVDVGKVGGGAQVSQEATNGLLLRHARAGREVVRLKGGDPFVFGRGGEEAQLLRAAGLDYEVVPGVTAGVAAPAYAGIPVTQRGVSAAVAFVTGHEDPAKPETLIDWPALAAFPGTLVFYMGVRSLERIASQLVAGGRPHGQPVAVVQRGTLADQRTVSGTLANIARLAAEAGVEAPAITVVGDVAALHEELGWFGAGPLAGRTVAVTRARAQASPLAARLRALGANVVEAPAIRIEPLEATLPDLAGFDLLCVTSPNGARRLLELLPRRARPARARDRGDRAGDGRRAARGRHRARRPAAARGRRVARRRAGGQAGASRADRARRAGPRRAARRAARARRRGRDRGALPNRRANRSARTRARPRSAPTS